MATSGSYADPQSRKRTSQHGMRTAQSRTAPGSGPGGYPTHTFDQSSTSSYNTDLLFRGTQHFSTSCHCLIYLQRYKFK